MGPIRVDLEKKMEIEVFSICDAATSDSGKLNILGAFDMMWVPIQLNLQLRMRGITLYPCS